MVQLYEMMASEPEVSNIDEKVDREERRASALDDDLWERIDVDASTKERDDEGPNRLQGFPQLFHTYERHDASNPGLQKRRGSDLTQFGYELIGWKT